jgi:hypothetical protein
MIFHSRRPPITLFQLSVWHLAENHGSAGERSLPSTGKMPSEIMTGPGSQIGISAIHPSGHDYPAARIS